MPATTTLPTAITHYIDLTEATAMADTYRSERENILGSTYKNAGILPLSETFNRDAVDVLLAQENCAGLRIYYGMDEALKVHAILVAVTEDNEDILPSLNNLTNEEDIIVEKSQRCPDMCPPTSPLNT